MEWLLIILTLVAIPSIIGASSYIFCRYTKSVTGVYIVASVPFLYVFSVTGAFDKCIFLLVASVMISKLGAWAHANTIDQKEKSKSSHFLMMAATQLSLSLGVGFNFLLASALAPVFDVALGMMRGIWTFLVFPIALLISPSLTPFLIWMVQSSQLRPGIDKHFDE